LVSFKEITTSTGRKHGAFFQPLPAWDYVFPSLRVESGMACECGACREFSRKPSHD
jgi:hypothetical protein